MKKQEWELVEWPYAEGYGQVWFKKIGRAKVHMFPVAPYSYCCSCGASSDYSYSGCLFNKEVKDVEQAKQMVEQEVKKNLGIDW